MSELDLQSKLIGKDVLKDSALYQEIHLVKQNNEQLIIELNT